MVELNSSCSEYFPTGIFSLAVKDILSRSLKYSKVRSNSLSSSLKSNALIISISMALTSKDLVSFIISSSTS